MGLMHDLTYNKKALSSLGFALTGRPFYVPAKRNIQFNTVSGRSEAVICDDESYDNVTVSYAVNSLPHFVHTNSQQLAYEFVDWLSDFSGKYMVLRDTYNEGYFTYAVCTNISQIANSMKKYLSATIEFSRVPFWYSDTGQKAVTGLRELTLINPERYRSKPKIRLYVGTQNHSFVMSINDMKFTFSRGIPYPYIDIDCEEMTASYEEKSLDSFCDFDYFPTLVSGNNHITVSGAIDKFEIIPNWRRL